MGDGARGGLVLKPEFAQKAKEIRILEPTAREEEVPVVLGNGKGGETSGGSGSGRGKGVPKWFKGFKK